LFLEAQEFIREEDDGVAVVDFKRYRWLKIRYTVWPQTFAQIYSYSKCLWPPYYLEPPIVPSSLAATGLDTHTKLYNAYYYVINLLLLPNLHF
jgi:hypothetical protein